MIAGTHIDGLAGALFHLLYHRTARRRFARGDVQWLGLDEQDRQELATIDLIELEATAKTIARNMSGGNSGGGGGLRQSFPITLALLESGGIASIEAMYRFLEAPAFGLYREVPHAGVGLSAEEAFYTFLQNDREVVSVHPLLGLAAQHEMLTALLSMLVVTARPSFTIETPLIHDNGRCRFACPAYPATFLKTFGLRTGETGPQVTEVPYLYAATTSHFIQGPVTPLIADVMEMGRLDEVLAATDLLEECYGLPASAIIATVEALERRGLIQ